jgi:lipopolysaccharide/colanic/teichoic acid biosynthesis glycosyltransferase
MYIGSAPNTIGLLENSGLFAIKQKDNNIAALNYLQKFDNIDAILSEVHLPGANGINTFKLLSSYKITSTIPFVLIAHQNEPEIFDLAFSKGLDDFYTCPLDANRIYERLKFLKEYKNRTAHSYSQPVKPYKTPLIKRIFDIVVAGSAIVVLSPLMLVVMAAIKIESKGPLIYVSTRVGANYNLFGFYKFRSMYSGSDNFHKIKSLSHLNQYVAEEVEEYCTDCAKLPEGEFCSAILYIKGERICENLYIKRKNAERAFIKLENDPRITKVGKIIRNTSIDELPQLFNILKGDMSIVGNRPLPLHEAEKLTLDDRAKRFAAAAGLTGLWQVELRGRKGSMSEEERFNLDNEYADNNSFKGDLKLIYRTFKAIFQRGNV